MKPLLEPQARTSFLIKIPLKTNVKTLDEIVQKVEKRPPGNSTYDGNGKAKIVGYPIGYPRPGKYQPPRPQRQSQEYKPNRTVNMATTQESSSAQLNNPSEAHFSARIELLQNQLNQVLMMM
ncbi:hypothetical protein Tco_1112156 [Tanacetum coccineum]|uniref:Uncharacterized protein n=1 Tax=Tanacetum coccineum TaxID=301880 RepID=A0ABQ5IRH2_9ASTR